MNIEARHPDAELIDSLGGPAVLSRRLGFKKNGVQRVQNWKRRGIPEVIRLRRTDVFGPAPALDTAANDDGQGVDRAA